MLMRIRLRNDTHPPMTDLDALRRMYEKLAERFGERGETMMRDSFLVLAADIALAADLPGEAERLRRQLLAGNPNHLVSKHPDFPAAAKAMDVRDYLADLRAQYPPERAEELLRLPRDQPTVRLSAETLQLDTHAAAALTAPRPPSTPLLAAPADSLAPAESEPPPHRWIATTLAIAVALSGTWLAYVSLLRPLFRSSM